jgi:hypothetical protein
VWCRRQLTNRGSCAHLSVRTRAHSTYARAVQVRRRRTRPEL